MTEHENITNYIEALLLTLELSIPGSKKHSERVALTAMQIGHELELSNEQIRNLQYASLLHDIGKVCFDSQTIEKGIEDITAIREHVLKAELFLFEYDWADPLITIIVHQLEHWDGTGYPEMLTENKIPLESLIIAVADTYDILTQRGHNPSEAYTIMSELSGKRFSPEVMEKLPMAIPAIDIDSGEQDIQQAA